MASHFSLSNFSGESKKSKLLLQTEYAIDSQFSTTTLSNRAVYVYKNDVQLLLGSEYTFSTTDDTINITATITAGDIIKIKDYNDTTGSFIPPTPTKMGITPKYTPEKITDNTYRTSQTVIVGHDGSRTIAYDDYRDDILLELEKRKTKLIWHNELSSHPSFDWIKKQIKLDLC